MAPTDDQFTALATRVYGAGPNVGQMSAIRRIHFESTTLVISTIRERVTSEGADKGEVAKRIPLAEKKQRREDQLARLNGITMTGELDPSHSLLDLANQMNETGIIVWLAPSKCSKRDDEVQLGLKDNKSAVQIENSQLKVGPFDRGARSRVEHRAEVPVVHDASRLGLRSVQSCSLGCSPTLGELHAELVEQACQSRLPGNKVGPTGES